MNILGICGSLRQDSWNLKLLRHATRAVNERGAETDIFDLNTVPMFHPDRQDEGFAAGAQALHEAIRAADAVMVACPEYNGTMTGALKNALEWASRRGNVLDGKVFFVMGTGPGRSGCVRMHMHATYSLESEGAIVVHRPRVLLPIVTDFMDQDGTITDPSIPQLLDEAAERVIWTASRLADSG